MDRPRCRKEEFYPEKASASGNGKLEITDGIGQSHASHSSISSMIVLSEKRRTGSRYILNEDHYLLDRLLLLSI